MLSKSFVHKAVNERVGTRIAVPQKLEDGEYSSWVFSSVIEEQIDLRCEERKPENCKRDHNGDQHANNPAFLHQSAVRVVWVVGGFTYWSPEPEGVRNAAVSHNHDQHGSNVQHQIEEQGVGYGILMGGEVFHALVRHPERRLGI